MLDVWLKALRQERLDLSFPAGGGLVARIVERPGLWMRADELQALSSALRTVAGKTLPVETLDYGVFSGDHERLRQSTITLITEKSSGRPIAFNALATMQVTLHRHPLEVTHLGLVMVDPDVRSRGLSWLLYGFTCIVMFVRNGMTPIWISNVTQVPAVVGIVSEAFGDVYPRPAAEARRSFDHLEIARDIMQRHRHVFGVGADAGFDEERFVITNAYTGGSQGLKKSLDQAAAHRNPIYSEFCRRELDYERGDDILQLGRLDLESCRRYVLDSVPRRSLPGVAAALAFVTVQRLVVPALRWFSADKPWGVLRPWR